MPSPQPVTLVAGTADTVRQPLPLAVVGSVPVPNATASTKGVVNRAAAVANLATDADLPTTVAKVNDLLAKLRTAGILAP